MDKISSITIVLNGIATTYHVGQGDINGKKIIASIEPVVDFVSAYSMITLSRGACDLYKIGLMSGKKYSAKERSDAECFFEMLKGDTGQKFYLKDTLITLLKLDRDKLPEHFVRRDYNLFEKLLK